MKMGTYSILKADEDCYLVSIVGVSKVKHDPIQYLFMDKAWARHQVTSSEGYAVYEVYGENAVQLVENVRSILNKVANEK